MKKYSLIAFYDWMHELWDRPRTERAIGLALIWIYLIALLAVEARRQGFWPDWLPIVPPTHYFSIQLAFTLILGLEVLGLIFILPASLSKSVGKQLEILTLILLRNAFKELSLLPEPVSVDLNDLAPIANIIASGVGALLVFMALGLYRKIARRVNFMSDRERIDKYVAAKKLLSLALLFMFVGLAIRDFILTLAGDDAAFFETIYTVLIFADIAMALIAQRFMPCYYAVFRNSGFVIGTLTMRLALSAPPILSACLAVFSALYVLALAWSTNIFTPDNAKEKREK
ncbi:MAG: hypothetical protein HDQ93_05715 [Desulfovibrio sp.]|nr:hypothetical protein [Desulfovibrio sp.]